MKPGRVVLLLMGVMLLTIFVILNTYMLLDRPLIIQGSEELPYFFSVDEAPGFDVANDVLRMGSVAPHSRARRTVTVQHGLAEEVHVRVRGPGYPYLAPEHPVYELVNGAVDIEFLVSVDDATPKGNYSGVVMLYFK